MNGALAAYLTKGDRSLLVFLPEDEPARSLVGTEVARKLFALATGAVPLDQASLVVGALAVEVVARAVVRAILTATGLPGIPAASELGRS